MDCKIGQEDTTGTLSTGPLLEPGPGQEGNNDVVVELELEHKEQTQRGTNPSIEVISMEEVSKETGGEPEYNSSTGPLLDPGPGLGGDNHVVVDLELDQEEHFALVSRGGDQIFLYLDFRNFFQGMQCVQRPFGSWYYQDCICFPPDS